MVTYWPTWRPWAAVVVMVTVLPDSVAPVGEAAMAAAPGRGRPAPLNDTGGVGGQVGEALGQVAGAADGAGEGERRGLVDGVDEAGGAGGEEDVVGDGARGAAVVLDGAAGERQHAGAQGGVAADDEVADVA